MPVLILLALMLAIAAMRLYLPIGATIEGKPLGVITLSFRERLLLQRTNLYCIGTVILLGALTRFLSGPLELIALLATVGLLTIPARYRFTSSGIALNRVVFRPWTDFQGYHEERGAIVLEPVAGLRAFRLRVLGSHREAALKALTRMVRPSELHGDRTGPMPRITKAPRSTKPSISRRRVTVLAVAVTAVLALGASFLALQLTHTAHAQEPPPQATPMANDASGNATGSGADLAGVAPGTLTAEDFTAAQKNEPFAVKLADLVNQNRLGINFTWTLVAGFLVMFMQAGFALVETGFCRAKSALHVMMTNFMVYGLGMLGYFALGFAFQFGGVGLVGVGNLGGLAHLNREWTWSLGGVDWGILGYKGFFLTGSTYDVGIAVMFLFQMVFMDTAATIPTGALAERWKWTGFCIYALFIGAVIYPVFGNWAWGGGWLSQLGSHHPAFGKGYLDFAGSGVVHAVGGWTALAGAMVLGPRLGKFNKDGTANAIPGHNLILATVGTFILAFGWFGFNPGSTLGAAGNGNLRIGMIATCTMLSGMAGSIVAMGVTWARLGKPDAGMMLNGLLAGLVAITAPSGYVSPAAAVVIGSIAGVLVVYAVSFFENVLKIDDPVGAISVHGVNGLWGQLALGIFADGTANYGGLTAKGALFGDFGQLGAQAIGAVVCFAWAFGVSWVFFKLLMAVGLFRSKPEDEVEGLDLPELGGRAYNWEEEFARGAWPMPTPTPARGAAPAGGGGR